jgi:hypothetical protein
MGQILAHSWAECSHPDWETTVSALDRLFCAHPHSIGESYAEHGFFALRFAGRLLLAGSAALVHAVIPCLCETTASRMILAMHAEIMARRAKTPQPELAAPLPATGALQVH